MTTVDVLHPSPPEKPGRDDVQPGAVLHQALVAAGQSERQANDFRVPTVSGKRSLVEDSVTAAPENVTPDSDSTADAAAFAAPSTEKKTVLVAGIEVPLGAPPDVQVIPSAPRYEDDEDDFGDRRCGRCKQSWPRKELEKLTIDAQRVRDVHGDVEFADHVTVGDARALCGRLLCISCVLKLVNDKILVRA